MAKPKKITQNINKDAGLMDLPRVKVPHSRWETKSSNYISSNIGDIVPIYVDEVLPDEKRRITMGMLSHMTTPKAPIFNAQYTEFRAFFVPHRLSADLLNGYSTRKSPFVKVFGEDNASTGAQIIVPLANQKLPDISSKALSDIVNGSLNSFGGILDALDIESESIYDGDDSFISECNFLNLAAYELIYQYCYRNENREAATNSDLYKWCFNAYNRASSVTFKDGFHKANREKDYFTGSQPFTQKGEPVTAGLIGNANVVAVDEKHSLGQDIFLGNDTTTSSEQYETLSIIGGLVGSSNVSVPSTYHSVDLTNLVADLSSASGINIEQLRIMIKTQELLEKDMMYGSKYIESLNAHFGTAPMSLVLEEPLELKKVTITSQMQPIFQTSSTANEESILGSIGANATTQSGEFEIVPETEFKEYGYLIICAVHKAQNSYDAFEYKPKHIFKKSRFDFYTPELNDLGFQPVQRKEFNAYDLDDSLDEAVSFNEAWAEYRFKFNKVHGMFEPSRANSLDFWTLAISNYSDVQSLYKQGLTELDRAVSFTSAVTPQFYDAYGFVEINDKPMSLHSIPGMDGVI